MTISKTYGTAVKTNYEKAEWFRKAEYGFFFHFLNSGSALCPPSDRSQRIPAPPEEWNRMVDSFDTEHIAKQLHELHAGYAWITVGQNSGYYCAPNRTYDRIMGLSGESSKCSRRDLIADFADALAAYGIPLLAYTTCQAPGYDFEAVRKLKSIPPWNGNANCGNYEDVKQFAGKDPRLREFLRMWSDIHAEWSSNWGAKVRGWWVDGCYFADKLHDFADEPNGESFARALRTGNPDSLVAFNPGVVYPPRRNYPGSPENYTAGEINDPEYGLLKGPVVSGLQYHVLTYAGKTWGQYPTRTDGRGFASMTRNIVDNGGVVSWDLPFTVQGIRDDLFSVLKEYAEEYRKSREAFPKTAVSVEPPHLAEDGTPVSGSVELEVEKEAEITLEWNGKTIPFKGRFGKVELSACDRNEMRLKLSCGGFERSFPVPVLRKFRFAETLSEPFVLNANGEKIGTYRFAVSDGVFRIEAELAEKESAFGKMPWENSCLELFLSADREMKRQFCFRHDGAVSEIDRIVVLDVPFASCRVKRDGETLYLNAELRLPDEFRNGSFFFDIQQKVNRAGRSVHGVLFGTGAPATAAEVVL